MTQRNHIEAIEKAVTGHSLVRSVDLLDKGHVRLETEFLYPDGSNIDLFVEGDTPLLTPSRLSDMGATTSWLSDMQVEPWKSKKRESLLQEALRQYRVTRDGGKLATDITSIDGIVSDVVRLGQACLRMADLIYTRRSSLRTSINEEVEETISDFELPYETSVDLEGRYGKVVVVDFLVKGPSNSSAILTLSSPNASQAHVQANEVFTRWYDLDDPSRRENRITVFDDRNDSYRDQDLRRLKDMSDVVGLSDKTTLQDLLAA